MHSVTFASISAIITFFYWPLVLANDNTIIVTLFEHQEFHRNLDGLAQTYIVSKDCQKIGSSMDEKVTSVRISGGCLELFKTNNCDGNNLMIKIELDTPQNEVFDLKLKDFDNDSHSMRLCT